MTDRKATRRLADGIRAGERRALARAITLVESTRADHNEQGRELLTELMPDTGKAVRVGISGAPGVGKSTFIEALGGLLTGQGHRVAVLAVDPTSTLTGGSILGDKTRMEHLSRNPNAFVRPSPSGRSTGGVARRTRESMLLCEAAGFDVVIVETVGVGQSETMVADMTDVFVLLMQPGGGDDLQGIKRGILELADVVLVNKADGQLAELAAHSAADYQQALQLLPGRVKNWRVPVRTCSALEKRDIDEAWRSIQDYVKLLHSESLLEERRAGQAVAWMWQATTDGLMEALRSDPRVKSRIDELEQAVRRGDMPATAAAQAILELFLDRRSD
ncbi:MAG TPA: methylmalonyl Co-A mutase-associated GTPase MeaB [Arenicellales bacterium]|nr:methylmalonyl Co-A mutase-associated GTPase MeaB [Arenicellales bacterium]